MKCINPSIIEGNWIRCGDCGGCRVSKMQEWMIRIEAEAKQAKSVFFTTTTYEESRMTKVNIYTGEICPTGTLNPEHHVAFMKSLRYYQNEISETKIRFFHVAEYGGNYGRPHGHYIFFNLEPSLNPILSQIWKHGHVFSQPISGGAINYVSAFHCTVNKVKGKRTRGSYPKMVDTPKKGTINRPKCDEYGRIPEYTRQSRNPCGS